MRILLVGAGGVGGAFAAIAARRDFFEPDRDRRLRRGQGRAARPRPTTGSSAAQIDASDAGRGREPVPRARHHPRDERGRPASSTCRSSTGPSPPVRTTSTWRCRCRRPHPEAPYEKTGVKLGDEQFAQARRLGGRGPAGAGRDRRRARAVRRVRAVRRRPPVQRDRRARHPRRRQPRGHRRRRQRDLRAVVLDVDHDRGVPQPAGGLAGRRVAHDGAVLRAGGLRLPRGHRAGRVRQRRARGGAPHAALGRLQAGDLQVRPRRRVHQHPQGAAHPRPRPHREGAGQGRRGQPPRRGRRRAARPGDRRAADDRQDLRRPVGHRQGQGRRAPLDVPLPRGRQRVDDARVRPPVRGLADRDQPGGRARAAQPRHLDRAPGCSVPRPSTRCRSSSCSRSTAAPGASASSPSPSRPDQGQETSP